MYQMYQNLPVLFLDQPINQSVLMKWKYQGFLNKHAEFHNLHNYFSK
jgi:hypothetical protein